MLEKNHERIRWTDKPHNFLGLPLNFTRYFLIKDKFIVRQGFLNITEDEILLYRVLDKRVLRPVTQRIFGCATVVVSAKDTYTPELKIKAIKNVNAFIDLFDELIKEARKEYKMYSREVIEGGDDFH